MSQTDYRRLVERASGGDRMAFHTLFREHRNRISAYVRSQLGPRLLAEVDGDDVLQEVSLRALRSIGLCRWTRDDCVFRWLV